MPILRQERRGGVLAGCLAVLGVIVVLLVAGGIFVAMNWRGWVASGIETTMSEVIDEADLSADDKTAMKSEVASLMQEFESGAVTVEQLVNVAEELAESPVLPAASIMLVDMQYIQSSELTDEEKVGGSKELSRFMRGLFDESISQTKIDDVTEPIHAPDASNAVSINTGNLSLQLKQPEDVEPDELRAFLANCKTHADEAGIADEKYQVDMAAEFSAAIDRALGRTPDDSASDGDADNGDTDAGGADAGDDDAGGDDSGG